MRRGSVCAWAVLLGGARILTAQTATPPPAVDTAADAAAQPATATTTGPAERPGFVALDGSGLVPLAGQTRRFLFGTSAIGGYDSAFAGTPGTGGPFEGGGVFGAVFFRSPRYYLALQNTGSAVQYRSGMGSLEYFDSASAVLGGSVRRTWNWDANVANAIGNDAVRAIGPVNTTNLRNLNVPSAEAPELALQMGMVFDNDTAVSLRQDVARRESWRFALHNSYRSVFQQHEQDNTVRLRAEYDVLASPRMNWGLFEETSNERGAENCSTEALGLTFERQLLQRLTLQMAGGPAVGTRGCVTRVTGSFYGAAVAPVRRALQLYASGSRKLNDSTVMHTTWETTAQAGAIGRMGAATEVRFDAGYLHGTQPAPYTAFDSSYEGASVQRSFRSGLRAALTARHFGYTGTGASIPQRTQVFATLNWSSERRPAQPTSGMAAR